MMNLDSDRAMRGRVSSPDQNLVEGERKAGRTLAQLQLLVHLQALGVDYDTAGLRRTGDKAISVSKRGTERVL